MYITPFEPGVQGNCISKVTQKCSGLHINPIAYVSYSMKQQWFSAEFWKINADGLRVALKTSVILI